MHSKRRGNELSGLDGEMDKLISLLDELEVEMHNIPPALQLGEDESLRLAGRLHNLSGHAMSERIKLLKGIHRSFPNSAWAPYFLANFYHYDSKRSDLVAKYAREALNIIYNSPDDEYPEELCRQLKEISQ